MHQEISNEYQHGRIFCALVPLKVASALKGLKMLLLATYHLVFTDVEKPKNFEQVKVKLISSQGYLQSSVTEAQST